MKEQRAFLWPRLVVGIRLNSSSRENLRDLLSDGGIKSVYDDGQTLLVDISHWQVQDDMVHSAEVAVARLQHFLNLHLSPLHYSLGIGNDAVWAYHAANSIEPGQEKWVLPWQIKKELGKAPVSVLRVLDKGMPPFFRLCGKHTCAELVECGKEFLVRRFGSAGETLWCFLQGRFCQSPDSETLPNGSISWSLSLPVRTRSVRSLSAHLWRLYSTVNRNLARLHRQAEHLELNYKGSEETGFCHPATRLQTPLHNRHDFYRHLERIPIDKNGIAQFQITASRLSHPAGQLELF